MKVIVDDKIPYIKGLIEQLCDEVVYLKGSDISAEDVKDADIMIVRTRTRCDARLLSGSKVKLVVTATIGYDHFDTEFLQKAGIRWTMTDTICSPVKRRPANSWKCLTRY